jgi:Ca2+/Na+ antiporter
MHRVWIDLSFIYNIIEFILLEIVLTYPILCLQISKAWELPVSTLLRLTIPQPAPSQWNRFYASANIALCPLALLYACNSFVPLNHPIVFLLPNTLFPLWSVVFMTSFSLAFLHFVLEKEPPKAEHLPVVVVAFVMSVFWISTTAGELVNCLEALGTLLKLPQAFLGLTVLAWGILLLMLQLLKLVIRQWQWPDALLDQCLTCLLVLELLWSYRRQIYILKPMNLISTLV